MRQLRLTSYTQWRQEKIEVEGRLEEEKNPTGKEKNRKNQAFPGGRIRGRNV